MFFVIFFMVLLVSNNNEIEIAGLLQKQKIIFAS